MSEKTLEKVEQQLEKSDHFESPMYKTPRVDVCEDESSFYIYLDMPGVPAEDVDVKLEKNRLSVVGHSTMSGDMGKCIYQEFLPVDYRRSFKLPDSIDKEKIIARMENGLLTLTMMKTESAKPIQIPVMSG